MTDDQFAKVLAIQLAMFQIQLLTLQKALVEKNVCSQLYLNGNADQVSRDLFPKILQSFREDIAEYLKDMSQNEHSFETVVRRLQEKAQEWHALGIDDESGSGTSEH